MKLTKTQKRLARRLIHFPLTEKEQEEIFLTLESDKERMMLMEYMSEHPNATAQELKNEVGRILEMTHMVTEDDNLNIEKINEYMKLSVEELDRLIEEELRKDGVIK